MKTKFTQVFKKCALGAFLLVTGWAHSATYTAVSSGAWTSASTWGGGTAPGSSLGTLDNVIIEEGVTVTLDTDVSISGLFSSIQVNGTLESTGDYLLDIDNAVLSGTGTLNLHRVRFGTTSSMTFSGDAEIDNLWNNALALDLVGELDLNDTLFLDEGSLNLTTGSSLNLTSGAVIRIDNGAITVSNGLLNTDAYAVMYVGTDKTAGLELSGSGLTDVWVELDDNDQALSITGNVTIEGTLHHNEGMIDLNGGSLTLAGDYAATGGATFSGGAASSLIIENDASLTSNLVFDEDNDALNNLTIDISGTNSNVNLGGDLTISGTLSLEEGDFTVLAGTLTMAAGSEIVIEEGHLETSGGSFDGTSAYDVTYSGGSTESGIELSGSGLNDLTIELENGSDSLEIMDTLTINGELELENGGIALNGYDLTLEGTLSTSSEGWFSGDEESDLTFNTATLTGDTVWFHASNNEFGTITINADDQSDLMIGNDLHVENIMMTGGGIQIWDSEIWVNSTGMITGASEERYITIEGSGSLVMNVQISAPYVMYPVGTDEGYSPAGLQQNTGTAGYYRVNVMNGVWSEGTTGDNWADAATVVDRTWDIESVDGTVNVDLNLMTMWSAGDEMNGFDRTEAYIMHYTNGSWDAADQTGSAAVAVGTMYQLEREGITSLSPFAVAEGETISVDENEIVAEMYPNPVQNVLNCVVTFDEATTAEVVDLAGNVLHSENVNGNHKIDFSAYPKGVYFVNYTNSKGTGSYKVVKSL
jgi:hypothetical protein